MTDILIVFIILAAVSCASYYIVKSKKKGQCIGCPCSKGCSGCVTAQENSSQRKEK